ncbi:MAG: LuxR family transcriptional regulator [Nocardioidaceae bacterium]|nr:LuxR family transcriptional regulator [Nocardioidaceae bacterium]
MNGSAKRRAKDRIAHLARQHVDLATFWRQSSAAVSSAVPHYMAPCWYTLDPASLLVTSHFSEDVPEMPSEWLAQEYYEDDVNKLADVARSERGISTLHDATGGHPSRSPRWQQNMAYGGDQEMVAALRTLKGQVWGALGLYRGVDQPLFDADDKDFILAIAPHLAEGARRALLVGEATDPEGAYAPGLVVLTDRWEVESTTARVEQWLRELPDGDWDAGRLPSSVLSVAGQALRSATDPTCTEAAVSRVLARSGTWVVLHGAALVSERTRRVAVIVEPAHPARISPLLMSAYGLTEREQDVTRLVLQGEPTTEIASHLSVSPATVQQHLKSVFDKTGVRSRRDLVGKVFFSYYEPRVRDNEHRVVVDKALRGGPLESSNTLSR